MRAQRKPNERESLEEVLKGVNDPAERVTTMIAWRAWDFWQPQVDKVRRIMSVYWSIVAEHGPDEVMRDYLIKQGWKPPTENIGAAHKKSKTYAYVTIPRTDSVYDDGPDSGRELRDDEHTVLLPGDHRFD